MRQADQRTLRRERIFAHVAASDSGVKCSELLPVVGVGMSCLQRDLQTLRESGELVVIIGNLQSLWTVPSKADAIRAGIKAAAAELFAARCERKNALRRARGQRRATSPKTIDLWIGLVLKALSAAPGGLTSAEVAAKIGRGIETVKRAMPIAKARGLCDSRRMGGAKVLWFHFDHFAAMQQMKAKTDAEAKLSRSRRDKEVAAARALAAFERPMIRRIVPAHKAPPLVGLGPSSVWGLAA